MPCFDSSFTVLSLLCGFFVTITSGRSWDFAVSVGPEIEFFAQNGTLTGQLKIAGATTLMGLAYDDVTRTLFLSDPQNKNYSIYSNNLNGKNIKSVPLLKKQNGTHILNMVFDSATRMLFWTDATQQAIMKMEIPVDDSPKEPVMLHHLSTTNPRGIALDVCNRHIYWVNSNNKDPSIERSELDGQNRIVVISQNLYEPLGVAIDHTEGKIYWIDDEEGIHYKIERSNLDGTDREMLVHGKHQQPVYIAVDDQMIYWTDWVHSAVWAIKKNAKQGDIPVALRSYYETKKDADPTSIITRDNIGTINCSAILRSNKTVQPVAVTAVAESYNNLTTSTEEADFTVQNSNHCLNNGHYDKNDDSCQCKPGFKGPACETSLCHNYCLQGNCTIKDGLPHCECIAPFSGTRCERDLCDGHCLHEGQCSVKNNVPVCHCKYSKGDRCEDLSEFCSENCAKNDYEEDDDVTNILCRCSETNFTVTRSASIVFNENFRSSILMPLLLALICVLLLLIGMLSFYVNKLRRRPRIKKRFVVSKAGVTPLTSRPQIPDNQCEITIENCCNMNICETPCFEPKLRTASPRTHGKKEEKNSLLDNMEGNTC